MIRVINQFAKIYHYWVAWIVSTVTVLPNARMSAEHKRKKLFKIIDLFTIRDSQMRNVLPIRKKRTVDTKRMERW